MLDYIRIDCCGGSAGLWRIAKISGQSKSHDVISVCWRMVIQIGSAAAYL
jgi:hypothetical protein